MIITTIKKLLLVILLCFVLFFIPLITLASDVPDFNLQVPIFNVTQTQDIAHYIAQIYTLILYILVPLAIVVIIFAGARWIMSGGDQGKIQDAKKYIISAFTGLFIALFSYLLLSEFGLTTLNMPSAQYIEADDDFIEFPANSAPAASQAGKGQYPSVGGKCFPIPAGSFSKKSYNFAAARNGGARKHNGFDIYTKPPGEGIAIADGQVIRISTTFKAGEHRCKDTPNWWISQNGGPGDAGAIYIYHPSLDKTLIYGENDIKKTFVKNGDNVKAGQVLAVFGPCRMLHLEIHEGKYTSYQKWIPPTDAGKPAGLIDPTKTLDSLPSCK